MQGICQSHEPSPRSSYLQTNAPAGAPCEDEVVGRRRAIGVLLALGLTSCSTTGLAFRQDRRLRILNLKDRSTIELPFELELAFDGALPAADGAVALGILVDWTPPPPGEPLTDLLRDDPACSGPAGCPDGYLERNRIHVTTDTSWLLDDVPVGTDRQERRGFHEVTIVLVDADGRRVGETFAFARFRTPGVNA